MASPVTSAAKVAKTSNRGSVAGERRGGRQKGTPNKATASIRDVAREYTDEAIKTLSEVMKDKTQPAAARVSAANAILDRGYGKPTQSLDHKSSDGTMSPPSLAEFYGSRAGFNA